MTVIEWDKVGERIYQTGIDRGVLYLTDGTVVPWNGLVSVDETTNSELKSFYLDGIKFLQHATPGEFEGKLKAITYPEEFDQVQGISEIDTGLSFYEQPLKSFGLSYRTKIGNDVDGEDHGYKIHLFYNLMAIPDSHSFQSIQSPATPTDFGWSLSGTPPIISGHRPTVHISLDSAKASHGLIQAIEDILYGTDAIDPRLPTIDEIQAFSLAWNDLTIVDNGDGTWTATDNHDYYITMLDTTTFQIDHANVIIVDPNTYQISTTDAPLP